jgi:hypothetical protein
MLIVHNKGYLYLFTVYLMMLSIPQITYNQAAQGGIMVSARPIRQWNSKRIPLEQNIMEFKGFMHLSQSVQTD